MLWLLAAALLVGLFSCASGRDDKAKEPAAQLSDSARAAAGRGFWKLSRPMRLMLAGSTAHDSVKVASEIFVDQAIRRALDSIPAADYVTLNYRDSLAAAAVKRGEPGVTLKDIGASLHLDGAIVTKIARFGSVLGVDLSIVDPKTREVLYKDLSFSFIRFRDSSGTMLIGPPLYDAIRKSLDKYFGAPHTQTEPVATESMLLGGIAIEKLPQLKQLSVRREGLTRETLKALAEYAVRHFPELVPLDREAREGLYNMFGLKGVVDYVPVLPQEKQMLFNVGIDRMLVGGVEPKGDSVRLYLELRAIGAAGRDSLVDANSLTYAINDFEKTTVDEDFVVVFVDIAEPIFTREAERVRAAYATSLKERAK